MPPGRLRVGRSLYGRQHPSYPEFTSIVSLTPSGSAYGDISPYGLQDEKGRILENVWQFSKVYPEVPAVSIPYSTRSSQIVWKWPAETHVQNGQILPAYLNWREQGMSNPQPVRNPVGWKHMSTCLYAVEFDQPVSPSNPPLDYIAARKKIYWPIYYRAVTKHPKFHELWSRWQNGENLLITEIDGPHQESLDYYRQTYGVPDNFIESNSMEVTPQFLNIMLNDSKHPFGHGYCLAWALLNYRP